MEMADPNENPSHLTLPANQAALAPFPPSCPVLVNVGGDSSGGETYLGQIHSVYIDLGSATRDNFYRVRPSASAPAEADSDLRSAPESALKYAPGCTVTASASALPPFVTEGGGAARNATVISCVSGSSSRYYLLDVAPGPDDSWTNIQSTVPADAVRYRDPAIGEGDGRPARVISPHLHTIPADEDGSLNSSSKAPPIASITIDTNRKRPAEASAGELDVDDGGSSTLSPMMSASAHGSASINSNDAISEEVVRRIDIPDSVDTNKIQGALVGPDFKIKQRMQAKFHVTITILGLGDTISDVGDPTVIFSKLGPIAFKAGDRCIMIQGSERKVHDAAKIVIHMLANKCYDGDNKDALVRELRVVRRVRKKTESPRALSESLPSPTKRVKTGPTEGFDAAKSGPTGAATPPQRGWSPPIEEDPQPDIVSTGDGQSGPRKNSPPPLHPLFMGKARCLGNTWSVDIRSPYDRDALFGRIIGEGASKKRELINMFDGKIFLSVLGDPIRISIKGPDQEIVERAAEYVANLLDRKGPDEMSQSASQPPSYYGRAIDGGTQQHNRHSFLPPSLQDASRQDAEMYPCGPMRLVSSPVWVGSHRAKDWQFIVKSPISEADLFGRLVGEGGENMKHLESKFSEVYFCIRGRGIRLKNGTISEGPLRVEVEGNDKKRVLFAARHVADILDSRPLNDRVPADSVSRQHFDKTRESGRHHLDQPSTSLMPSAQRQLIMGKPSYDGQNWSLEVLTPLDPNWTSATPLGITRTFKLLIGEGGSRKKALLAMFSRACFFCLRGDGITCKDQNGMLTDGPLRLLIKSPQSEVVVNFAEHISGLIVNEEAGDGIKSNRRHHHHAEDYYGRGGSASSNLRLPDPATPVDTQYGTQEWKTVVYASCNRLGHKQAMYFGSVVGQGGSILRDLMRQFGVRIKILGEGVTSDDVEHHPRDPMNARIVGPSRQSVDNAALHIDRIWGNIYKEQRH